MFKRPHLVVPLALAWLAASCAPEDQGRAPSSALIAANDRGVALMGQYKYAEAEQVFAEVAAEAPGWLDARVNRAVATLNRQQEGDERLAIDILASVLEEAPGDLRALYTTAILNLYLGDAEAAAGRLEQVVAADPNDAYAAYFLGQSLLQQGDYAAAAERLLASAELDPYLRSAYWAGSQALRRIGRDEDAARLLADYQRFESNPAARLAGFSYARMGPKARALSTTTTTPSPAPLPDGPLFGAARDIDAAPGGGLTTADIDGDGRQDLFAAGSPHRVYLGLEDGGFAAASEHPLAAAPAGAPLWGDVDDDGRLDVVLCGPGGSRYWRQTDDGGFAEALLLGEEACAAGALFDADHDGDLDLFATGPAGSELFANNRDGSFRRSAEAGLKQPGRRVLVADFDGDQDQDILVLRAEPPHAVWQNDRTWQYRPFEAPGFDDLTATPLLAATVLDDDADGQREIVGLAQDGSLPRWRKDGGAWRRDGVLAEDAAEAWGDGASPFAALSVADFDGDGRPELLQTTPSGLRIVDPRQGEVLLQEAAGPVAAIAVVLDPGRGPALATSGSEGLRILPPGPGRHRYLALVPTGRHEGEQMRSNASGIGTLVQVRSGGRWSVFDALDPHSGPGQSLQPLSAGLGGVAQADYVALQWSDGVTQTELDLAAGERHTIAETERQLASCPVLFAWDGARYEFVSDMLGGAALGYLAGPGAYTTPRPVESYLLGADALAPRNGRYLVKLGEPMEENIYLDHARLAVYDLPPDWSMVLDERLATGGAPATGRPIFFRRSLLPSRVVDANGEDVTELATTKCDYRGPVAEDAPLCAPPPGPRDRRFIGLLREEQILTLSFAEALPTEGAALVADGWIEYPYSQTVFAAWQAGLGYRPPTLEGRVDGRWQVLAAEFGYPAGMPRTMVLPLPMLPAGVDALRLASNMEIYWDRLRVVVEEPLPGAETAVLQPTLARAARSGFAKRSTGAQRRPYYDYERRAPYWDAKVPHGLYTRFGEVTELLAEVDGALAIVGSGEEVHLEFQAPAPRAGRSRHFAITFHGWAKDMDLYTQHGHSVTPLPPLGASDTDAATLARRDELHARYNVRFQTGY